MAASAADIRSALSLATPSPSTPIQGQPRKATPAAKKPEGISRELYALIGPSAPSLAAQLAKPRLKQKPNLGGGGKAKWYAQNAAPANYAHSERSSYRLQGMAPLPEQCTQRFAAARTLGKS